MMKITRNFAILYMISFSVLSFAQRESWKIQIDSANIFSSPRFTDLNSDGVKDVVLGGGVEAIPTPNGIIAIDGKTGQMLWNFPTPTQTYTSAMFQDITGDKIDDVFIGGRAGSFFAINGNTGELIWEFFSKDQGDPRTKGILNFYATQWIVDQDKDGYKDLLVSNGGDYLAKPEDKERGGSILMVISSKSGSTIKTIPLPEKRETYYAPHTVNSNEETYVIFGSGGETIDGGLWKVKLSEVLNGKMKNAVEITHDSEKGFILNSLSTDINGDQTPDILNARMNGTLSAFDGQTNRVLWEHNFPGYECYVTPSFGHFNEDGVPDFFTIISKGTFPIYQEWRLIAIDGASGKIIMDEVSGFNQFSPAVCADLNDDKIDEIIFVENALLDPSTFLMINQVKVIDIRSNKNYYIGPVRTGISMASTPSLEDLNNDGKFELVLAVTTMESENEMPTSIVQCLDLEQSIEQLTWPVYLGPNENGSLEK